jgi:hypothetical protein
LGIILGRSEPARGRRNRRKIAYRASVLRIVKTREFLLVLVIVVVLGLLEGKAIEHQGTTTRTKTGDAGGF